MNNKLAGICGAILLCDVSSFAQNVPGGRVTLTWQTEEVVAATGAPSFASPGVIEPGEGVRFRLGVSFAPPVGTHFQWFAYDATVVGWGSSFFDFLGPDDLLGVYSRFAVPPEVLTGGDPPPGPVNSISVLIAQRGVAGEPVDINPSNPFQNVLTFDWTPMSYAPRTVSFLSRNGVTAGQSNSLAFSAMSLSGVPFFADAGATGIHNPITPIQIVPAPASLALLASAAAFRRKR